jgi:hypothetical protein
MHPWTSCNSTEFLQSSLQPRASTCHKMFKSIGKVSLATVVWILRQLQHLVFRKSDTAWKPLPEYFLHSCKYVLDFSQFPTCFLGVAGSHRIYYPTPSSRLFPRHAGLTGCSDRYTDGDANDRRWDPLHVLQSPKDRTTGATSPRGWSTFAPQSASWPSCWWTKPQ